MSRPVSYARKIEMALRHGVVSHTRSFGARVSEKVAASPRLDCDESPVVLWLKFLLQLFVIDALAAQDNVIMDGGQFSSINAQL